MVVMLVDQHRSDYIVVGRQGKGIFKTKDLPGSEYIFTRLLVAQMIA